MSRLCENPAAIRTGVDNQNCVADRLECSEHIGHVSTVHSGYQKLTFSSGTPLMMTLRLLFDDKPFIGGGVHPGSLSERSADGPDNPLACKASRGYCKQGSIGAPEIGSF